MGWIPRCICALSPASLHPGSGAWGAVRESPQLLLQLKLVEKHMVPPGAAVSHHPWDVNGHCPRAGRGPVPGPWQLGPTEAPKQPEDRRCRASLVISMAFFFFLPRLLPLFFFLIKKVNLLYTKAVILKGQHHFLAEGTAYFRDFSKCNTIHHPTTPGITF